MDLKLNEKACRMLESVRAVPGVFTTEYTIEGKRAFVIDAGVNAKISEEDQEKAGLKIADASMGCLGEASIKQGMLEVEIPSHPLIAALGCQLAAWPIDVGGKTALGSGPARILARKPEKLIEKLNYSEPGEKAALILETDVLPDMEACRRILIDTNRHELYIAAFKTESIVGLINILARIAEVGIYRLKNIGFDVSRLESASGKVPYVRQAKDVIYAGNDAIIYKGSFKAELRYWRPELTEKTVSFSSFSYGKPFKELYEKAGGDFYKIDPDIFAPAMAEITDTEEGRTYSAGKART